jgi:hypothetical protein
MMANTIPLIQCLLVAGVQWMTRSSGICLDRKPDPEIGYWGSYVAAPVFHDIAEELVTMLNILPIRTPHSICTRK